MSSFDQNAATVSKNGFMTKVEFFSGEHAGEEVYLNDKDLDLDDDNDQFSVIDRALEELRS
jgi:hypothetical protein